MVKEFMNLEEVFSGDYKNDLGVLNALDSFAEGYSKINDFNGRRSHNRDVFSFLREVFYEKGSCDGDRIITCYKYYFDKREEILSRKSYQGDLI
ncbi:MAG: hypothetical protein AABW83_02030 [Nanoarchaeota archaeon]